MHKIVLFLFVPVALTAAQGNTAAPAPGLDELKQMTARFVPTPLKVDTSQLSKGDQQALLKLIQAAKVLNPLFMQQLWTGNLALYQKLQHDKTPLGQARLHYFWINKGPWSEIDEHKAFLPGVPSVKPPGAGFYPEDMSKKQFEDWAATLSAADRTAAEGFFTVIARGPGNTLKLVKYSDAYKQDLAVCARLFR